MNRHSHIVPLFSSRILCWNDDSLGSIGLARHYTPGTAVVPDRSSSHPQDNVESCICASSS